MNVTFFGPRFLRGRDISIVTAFMASLPGDTRVITGGNRGCDTLVTSLARRRGLQVHTVIPSDRSALESRWRQHCTSFEEMHGVNQELSLAAHATRLIELADYIVAFAEFPEHHQRSRFDGTWKTVRIARKTKPVRTVLLRSTTEPVRHNV